LLPFLLASVPKEKVAPKEKDFRPRYAKFAMQLLRLGSGEKTLHTFFLNDQKESKTSCSLSFERTKEIVYCFLGKMQGKPYLTFFLSDEKESKQRKNRRHRFIGRFFLYTNGVNLNTLFLPCFSAIWLFHHHILC